MSHEPKKVALTGATESADPRDPSAEQSGDCDETSRARATEVLEEMVRQLTEELATCKAEAAANFEKFVRERAEVENFKKRMQRERVEGLRFASEGLIRDLLPVIDNLERAVDHAESGGGGQPLVEGVRMVVKNALDVMERHAVRRVEAVGQPFDPTVHEAIARVPDADQEPNRVVRQFQPGYRLHDRLLRPAQVSVSAKPPVEKSGDDD